MRRNRVLIFGYTWEIIGRSTGLRRRDVASLLFDGRGQLFQWLFRVVHPDVGMWIASEWSIALDEHRNVTWRPPPSLLET